MMLERAEGSTYTGSGYLADQFLAAINKNKASCFAVRALTTTMPMMKRNDDLVVKNGIRIRLNYGWRGTVTGFRDRSGDGYARMRIGCQISKALLQLTFKLYLESKQAFRNALPIFSFI
jgi:hypothetical protein